MPLDDNLIRLMLQPPALTGKQDPLYKACETVQRKLARARRQAKPKR